MGEGGKRAERSRLTGILLIVAAAVLWGTTGTSQALAPPGSTPQTIGAMRLLIGGTALAIFAFSRNRSFLKGIPIPLAGLAGFFVATYQLCFFWGVSLTGVAVGTIVGIGSSPVFAGILDALVLRKKPSGRWYLSTVLALAGCLMLLGNSDNIKVNLFGIVLAAGAGLSYAVYALCLKLLLPGRQAESVTAVVFCVGAIILFPLLIGTDITWVFQPAGLLIAFHLGLIATGLSYLLFTKGLETVQVSTAVTLSLAEPITAALLGVLVVGERLSPAAWTGLVFILSGLILLALPTIKTPATELD